MDAWMNGGVAGLGFSMGKLGVSGFNAEVVDQLDLKNQFFSIPDDGHVICTHCMRPRISRA